MNWLECPYRSIAVGTGLIAVAVTTLVVGMSVVNVFV